MQAHIAREAGDRAELMDTWVWFQVQQDQDHVDNYKRDAGNAILNT